MAGSHRRRTDLKFRWGGEWTRERWQGRSVKSIQRARICEWTHRTRRSRGCFFRPSYLPEAHLGARPIFLPIRLSPCHSVLVLIFSAFFFFPHSLPVEAIHSWRRSWSLGFSPVEAILDLLVPTGDAGLSIAAPDSYLKVRLPLASSSYLRFTS